MIVGTRRLTKKKAPGRTLTQISIADINSEYLEDCLARGVKKTSITVYARELRRWHTWCQSNEVEWIMDVERSHIVKYLCEIREAALSEISVRDHVTRIRAVLKYAHQQEYVYKNCLADFKIPKASKPYVYMATYQEISVIMQSIAACCSAIQNPNSRFRNEGALIFFCRRDQAILSVQVSVGLRISETLGLRLEDYNQERRELNVRHSKTGRPRAVPVSALLAEMIAVWLAVRPVASATNFLFVTEIGLQLHGPPWSRQFQRYIEFARSERGGGHALPRITLSSIRHIPATAMAEAGGVYHASILLGHTSTKVTEISYIHRKTEIIRATHDAADPLAGILAKKQSDVAD